ncbi:MAG: FecR family protein [Anaerolineae bacterium]|nr:FecR family protein [Anaerolineae bacterium]
MRTNPERIAWVVLLASFLTLCAICIGVVLALRWFVLESTEGLYVELLVSRNTVGVSPEGRAEETERASRLLAERTTLTTDSTSQAFVTFRDPYTGRVLAGLTLLRDSAVTIHHASRPRFDASELPYVIEVLGRRGRADVLITPDLPRHIQFRVFAPYDTTIDLGQRGYFTVALGGDSAGVTVREGEARISLGESGPEAVINQGQRGSVPGPDPETPIDIAPARSNLLVNSGFDLYDQTADGLASLPSSWGCYNAQDELDEPRGAHRRENFDGRAVLHIARAGETLNHAETGCRQPLSGLDLSDYGYLELRAVIYIGHQGISTCGIAGSECPVMLRLVYDDENGERREWIHGFYSLYTIPEWPLTCASCRQDHERINSGAWYTYESGNLVNVLPEEAKIHTLVEVRFYASGHAYDVMLDEVALLAAR